MTVASGYAIKTSSGELLVHTVCPTEIGAMANWLFTNSGIPVMAGATDAQIRDFFNLLHKHAGVELTRVEIKEAKP